MIDDVSMYIMCVSQKDVSKASKNEMNHRWTPVPKQEYRLVSSTTRYIDSRSSDAIGVKYL